MSSPSPEQLLNHTKNALASHEDVFAIGGSVDISPPGAGASQNPPLIIRWDSPEVGPKLSLPVGTDDGSQEAFARLLRDCAPATFGHGGEAVFDEEYREARKLDVSQFCTSFNPYEHGVMDTITQALVHAKYLGLRAELYNLNVSFQPRARIGQRII